MYQLKCAIKNYEWGKYGEESFVAQLIKLTDSQFQIENKPYAELWMGTHPSGPSFIVETQEYEKSIPLSEWIEKNPICLGTKVTKIYGNQLPFLFKVLSVNKALSIQAHPDKKFAEQLHQQNSSIYPDSNHKPEMAIALTEFEALCGFRQLNEIQNCLKEVPELYNVIGNVAADAVINASKESYHSALKKCFSVLMNTSEEQSQYHLKLLTERFSKMKGDGTVDLFLRIQSQFPDDIGCFSLFFLNYIVLKPGEALFLAANEPHAYLYGDCIECMACSDNVVRAGLTPKFKDIKTLCSMLTYECRSSQQTLFYPYDDPLDQFQKIFKPPISDFVVSKINIPFNVKSYKFNALNSACILLIVEGNSVVKQCTSRNIEMKKGTVLFVSSGESFDMEIKSGLLMFCAYCDP